jgi:hypothetical protein
MNKRRRIAQVLLVLGSLDVCVGATLHLIAGYPIVTAALGASNMSAQLQGAMRAVFVMIGCVWIMIALVALMAGFAQARIGKTIVLFCGLGLLVQIPVWVRLMGWFVGNEMFLGAAVCIVCSGLLLPPATAG